MKRKLLLPLLFLLFLIPFGVSAQTTLAQGDVAIIHASPTTTDKISFIFLKDVAQNTVVNFTDNGWDNATTPRTTEGFLIYTVSAGGHKAGTVLSWSNGMTITGTGWNSAAPTNFSLNSQNDQLFAFTGSTSNWGSQSGITLLFGVDFGNAAGFLTTGSASSSTSYLPSSLTLGTTAVQMNSSTNGNVYFANGTSSQSSVAVSGTASSLMSLFTDNTKYFKSNASVSAPTYTFTVYATEPTTISSGLSFTSVTTTGMTINWSGNGNGANRIVVLRPTSSVSYTPTDGSTITASDINSVFSSAVDQGSGNRIVYRGGSGSSIAVTGLTQATTYFVAVYEYNGTDGTGSSGLRENYLTSSKLTGSQSTSSPSTPTISTTGSLSNFGTIVNGANSAEQTFTVGGDNLTADVLVTAPAHFQVSQTSGSGFGSTTTLTRNGGGSGTDLQGEPVTVYVRMHPASAAGAVSNTVDLTSSGAVTQQVSVAGNAIDTEPTSAPSVSFGTITSSSIVVNVSGGDGAKRLLIIRSGSAVSTNPTDGTTYTASATYASGTAVGAGYVVLAGTGTSVTVTGLSAGTTYHFAVYAYNDNTGTAGAENYFATSGINNQTTDVPTYTWNVASGSWGTAGNWTPTRTSPSTVDVLVFDGSNSNYTSGVTSITMNTTQTIGQIKFINNVSATVISNADQRVVTIDGGITGTDFSIESGSTVTFDNNSSGDDVEFNITTGETGSVAGTLVMQGTAGASNHKLRAIDASSVTVTGTVNSSTNMAGNVFGDGTGTSAASTIVFNSGATYRQGSGSNPFALTAPSGVAIFNSGSNFIFEETGTGSPSLSGRTYGNFEINCSSNNGLASLSGAKTLTINGNLTITDDGGSGVSFQLDGSSSSGTAIVITGNISVASGKSLDFTPGSSATINLSGSGTQVVSGAGTLTIGSNANLSIGASSTVQLSGRNLSIPSTLTIASGGKFDINGNTLTLSGTLAGSGTIKGSTTSNLTINGSSGAFGTILMDQTGSGNCLNNFTFNRTGGSGTLAIGASNPMNVYGIVTPTKGTLTTNDVLTLKATTSTSYAQIAYVASHGTITGNVTGEFVIPANTGKWRNFASPFTGTGNTLSTLSDDIYIYSGSTYAFCNAFKEVEAEAGAGNKGYWQPALSSDRLDDRGVSVYLWSENLTTAKTVDVAGAYRNTDYTTPSLTRNSLGNDSNTGWHLIPNPWPSNYQHTTTTIANLDNSNTIYLYDNGTLRFSDGTGASTITNNIIPAYHSFYVEVQSAGTLTFPESNRTTSNSASYNKTGQPDFVSLKVTDKANNWDQTFFYSDANAKNSYDAKDAQKRINEPAYPSLYSTAEGHDVAINHIFQVPDSGLAIPVAFTSQTEGIHTMSFASENITPGVKVVLEDLLTHTLHAITSGNYVFVHNKSDDANRFVLHYSKTATINTSVTELANNKVYVGSNNNTVNISVFENGNFTATVYDITGRVISPAQTIDGGSKANSITVNGISAGYYIVKVSGQNVNYTTKVFLQ